MHRKDFLKKIILSLPAAAILQTQFSSCREDIIPIEGTYDLRSYKGDILIIGAGMSGIAAARSLKLVGLEPVILEAGYNIGGRIKTEERDGMVLEYGASFIYGSTNNPITQMARDAGAILLQLDSNGLDVYDDKGALIQKEKMNEYYNNYETLIQQIKGNASANKSFAEVMNVIAPSYTNDLIMRFLISIKTELNAGASIDKLSSLYFDDKAKYTGSDLLVINGFDKVVKYLALDLTVLTNYLVKRINYKESKVYIETPRGEFTADRVLVTVPLGVLQNRIITFDPPLPLQKIEAIMRLKMSSNEKLTMKFGPSIYEHPAYSLGVTSAQSGKFNYFLNMNKYASNNAFTTYLSGNYGDTGWRDAYQFSIWACENIWKIFPSVKYGPSKYFSSQWKNDSCFYGAFSYVPVGVHSSDYDIIAEDVDKKLFFAGEHTDRQYSGTVHGAYLSGIRAAKEIISSL